MSQTSNPVPVTVVPDNRPTEVVVITHSPLFYWWPVWVVGFLMAALTYWSDEHIAFVPTGTIAVRQAIVEGQPGPRDVLIAPEGQRLPVVSETKELAQPWLRMSRSNEPGIIWMLTLLIVIVVTHMEMRGVWSLVVLMAIIFATILLAALGWWEPILRTLGVVDVHINSLGYLSISAALFVVWLVMLLVIDPLKYMVFTRGRLRVRKAIGEGEKVFDMRGMVFKRHRDDMFRHWMLGFGTADLTVFTSGANAMQIEMENVFGIGRKLDLINKMLQEMETTQGR